MHARGRTWQYAAALIFSATVALGAQTAAPLALNGTIFDQTGAVLPGTAVDLLDAGGMVVQTVAADGSGAFQFDRIAPGQYTVRATFEGFKPGTTRLRVGPRQPAAQKIVLALADVKEEVSVSNSNATIDTSGGGNQDAVAIDQGLLDALPTFDQDLIGTVSRFLDAGAVGNGGVTIVVNGMEVSALNVTASAVQQIRINQDPYSAEYSRPGRGRIEILTKPGTQQFHGEDNLVMRNARFNARNPFALARPPEQRRILEGTIGGPVGHGGETSFFLSANDNAEDQQVPIVALGPAGEIRGSTPELSRRALLSLSITNQRGRNNTISVRPVLNYEREDRAAGGTTLASAGTTFEHREQQVTYTQQTILPHNFLNQLQFLAGHEREPTSSTSADPGLVVAGAFTGGGAQDSVRRTERHINLTESLAWTNTRHFIQAGFQLPDWSRRGFFDRSNFGGTFYFAGLDAFTAGRPYSFTQTRGNGDVVLLDKQVGSYIKDDWQIRPGLSASFGVRHDWQNYFHDNNNFAPRISFAYSPGNNKTNVIRGGLGFFNDRSGPAVIADLLHDRPGGLTRIVIPNPSYPDPFAGVSFASQPRSIVRLAPDVQIPQTLQYSLGLEHQLQKTTTVSVTYTGSHGHHLFRSRDVNAPPPPLYLARPDATYGVIRQVESDGRQRTHSVQVSLRGRVTKWFNGQTQYTWNKAWNDTNGIGWFPANDYDLSGEWARADFDRRHRLIAIGRVNAGSLADVGISLSLNSGAPYTESLGQDVFNNGRGRARPAGVPRNSLEGDGYADLDIRIGRDLKMGGGANAQVVTVGVDGFNVLNRVNYGNYVGTLGSPFFGRAVGARDPRQIQFSARLKF